MSARDALHGVEWTSGEDLLFLFDVQRNALLDLSPALLEEIGLARSGLLEQNLDRFLRALDGGVLEFEAVNSLPTRRVLLIDAAGQVRTVELACLCQLHLLGRVCALMSLTHLPYRGRMLYSNPVQEWALSAYGNATQVLVQERTTGGILQGICKAVTDQKAYTMAWVGVAGQAPEKRIHILASAGSKQADISALYVSWDEEATHGRGIVGEAVRTGRVWIVQDTHDTERFLPWMQWGDANGVRSLIALPFQLPQKKKGVLAVYSALPYAFDEMPLTVFSHLTKQLEQSLAYVDSRSQLQYERSLRESVENQLVESYLATIQALAASVEARDQFTAGHQRRTGWLAEQMGRRLGWDEARLQGLHLAAAVHDIGKLNIPIEVLCKADKLTEEEWQQIRNHPMVGYRILKDIPFPWKIAETVLQHHERLDGSGYPQGLKGEEIIEEARVLIVADMLDAMASDRPYRKAMALDEVLRELRDEAGSRLDAEVVRVALELFEGREFLYEGLELEVGG